MNPTRKPNIRHRVAAAATALLIVGSGIALNAAPASAATTPSQWGAGWLTRDAAGAVSSWSTTGGKPAITGHAGGKWDVRFPGITGAFGVPAVTPGNQYAGAMCAIDSYGLVSGSLTVELHCLNHNGVSVDSDFTVTYTSIPGATEAWVDADQPGVTGISTPAAQYDSAGGKLTIAHNAAYPGQYRVNMPGVSSYPSFGSMTATPVIGGSGHCTTGPEIWDDHTVLNVYCFNGEGTPTDMRFVAHLVGKRALLSTAAAKSGWAWYPGFSELGTYKPTSILRYTSNARRVIVNHTAAGAYTVTFKGLAAKRNGAQAYNSQGPGSADVRCGAVASASDTNAIVTVKCADAKGTPTDTTVIADGFGT
jgi:hypothetical protein